MMKIAVVGAGWAGAAAALTLARAGVQVTVYEATRSAGGRARCVQKEGRNFDNGQHLLLGAYARALSMISSLHTDVGKVLIRSPLALRTVPASTAPLTLSAPRLIAPFHLLCAIGAARGLSLADRLSTLMWAARHLRKPASAEWLSDSATVSGILESQPGPARQLLWEPLCIAALNTPPETASARVFVDVLHQSFAGSPAASDLIIPRVDLSQLLPLPALAEVARLGGEIRMGQAALSIALNEQTVVVGTRDDTKEFASVVIATGPQHVARLLSKIEAARAIAETLAALEFEPITTLHFDFAWVAPGASTGMLMLDGHPGQWLFWQQLRNGTWRASVVISAHHRSESEVALTAQALAQLRRSYALPAPSWHLVITEKRATYACTPRQRCLLADLPKQIGRLYFAGDWCFPALPATLEAAVISGENAAQLLLKERRDG